MNFSEDLITQIDDYLDNNLDASSRQSFEEQMNIHAELKELVLLNQQMREQYNDEDWPFIKDSNTSRIKELETYFKSEEGLKDAALLKTINEKYKNQSKPIKKINRNIFIGIAASIILLVGYFVINQNTNNFDAYYNWDELPSLVAKADENNNLLVEGELAFTNNKFDVAKNNFEIYLQNDEEFNATILVYYGLSQLELNEFEDAIKTFDILIKSDAIDKSKGYWYKALIYLKIEDNENAKKELGIILKDASNFNYKKAKKLLEQLN